ncbi:MAG: SDR family oxidoreductase [Synergistaceae bacterium]|jgi:3-oxoacyl-[acyl-carrier protein] reductase|nr:SDR family oxidoreductase [Synergistaceae bacterium]
MKFDFTGKVAVLTGGARGIGAAASKKFAELGAKVAILDMLEDTGKAACDAIAADGGTARFHKADVADMAGIRGIMDAVAAEWGKVDILVCCAGIVFTKPCMECTDADWDRVMNINAKGVFNCCHSVLPGMMERRYGKIVNLSSIAAKTGGGFFGNLLYGASKAAVISYSKGIAREAGPFGVNVNVICPGPTDTPMLADMPADLRKATADSILLKRLGDPEEIADVILFLASDYASFMTSEVLNVEGGIMKGN